jgi:uncharacterized protein YndB with AHSA1/START domain
MKLLKRIFFAIVIIIAIPLILALFIKQDYAIEKEIVIERPSTEVFEYIKYLKNQDHYSVWAMTDPKMTKKYKGTDGTVGFVSAWKSKNENIGAGEQEITKIEEGTRIETQLRFKLPFEAEDDAYMETRSAGPNKTKVLWGFKGKFPYPMNIISLFIDMDKEVGGDLKKGLENLKEVMEKKENI